MAAAAVRMACRPAPAQAIHGQRRRFYGYAAAHCRDAGKVHVLLFGVDDIAEYNMADLVRRKARALHTLADNFRCELSRRNVLQCSPEFTDGCAHRAQDDDFSICHGPVPSLVLKL
jgi:hypothetical protein